MAGGGAASGCPPHVHGDFNIIMSGVRWRGRADSWRLGRDVRNQGMVFRRHRLVGAGFSENWSLVWGHSLGEKQIQGGEVFRYPVCLISPSTKRGPNDVAPVECALNYLDGVH